ncbi:MAG: zinc-dependent metalloprotease [Flavobacteriales bacterium]|nr:zinc-dependent metalloprotease [Flavobacteriales bacterium]
MNRLFTLIILAVLVPISLLAQNSVDMDFCGVGVSDGMLIKQRMLDNRANIDLATLNQYKNREAITYIPITFHLIGDDNGEGYMDLDDVFRQVCSLNEYYSDQDVQFYINFPFMYIDSQDHYEDMDAASSNFLTQQKDPNSLNIFVGPAVLNPTSSYYTPQGDWLFLLESMAQGDATTLAHEIGHLFTLPHTFVGWEGEDARDYEGGPSPSSVGWFGQVEFETRGAGKNCYNAADGFCDTPADYFSFRAPCPMNYDIRDPNNVSIDPDEENIMSYYYDACVFAFSQEQKDAIAADIISRGWDNFSPPIYLTNLDSAMVTANFPMNSDTIGIPVNNELTLNWEPVNGADGYLLLLTRTHAVAPVNLEYLVEELIMGQSNTSYVVDTTLLVNSEHYRWRVTPINSYKPCADFGDYHRFYVSGVNNADAGDSNGNGVFDPGEIAGDVNGDGVIGVGEVTGDTSGNGVIDGNEVLNDTNGDGVFDANDVNGLIEEFALSGIELYPNPANEYLTVDLGVNEGIKTMVVMDMTGKIVQSHKVSSSKLQLDIHQLSSGVYYVNLGSETQQGYYKFVKL